MIHVVKQGDTLWGLARKYYGEHTRWPEIAEFNRLVDGNRILVGQRLQIPHARLYCAAPGTKTNSGPRGLGLDFLEPSDRYSSSSSLLLAGQTKAARPLDRRSAFFPSVPIVKPVCTIELSKDSKLWGWRYDRGLISIETAFIGSAVVSSEGMASCTLSNEGVAAEVGDVATGSARLLTTLVPVPGLSANGGRIAFTLTLRGANGGSDVRYELEFNPPQVIGGQFELSATSTPQDLRIVGAEGSSLSGRLALHVTLRARPLIPAPVTVPVAVEVPQPRLKTPNLFELLQLPPGSLGPPTWLAPVLVVSVALLALTAVALKAIPIGATAAAAMIFVVALQRVGLGDLTQQQWRVDVPLGI